MGSVKAAARPGFIIAGTDTDIGKTVAAAMLTLALDAAYWKPVQSGTAEGTDTQTVRRLTGLLDDYFLPEEYIFSQPLSPHRAAELDGVAVDLARLIPPPVTRPLLIEAAGGLLVPLTRDKLSIDIFRQWQRPIILCARTGLGTINHTLLSVEALRHRHLPLHGILFIGDDMPDTIRTIADFSQAKILGRLPRLAKINRTALQNAFAENFKRGDFI